MAWYADDNKMSHKNPAVISDIINKVKKHFGYISVVIWNKHTFLGMKKYIKGNILQVDMVKQLEECISMFGEDISTSVSSPATNKLF